MTDPTIRFPVREEVFDSGTTEDDFVVTMLHTGVDETGQWWTWLQSRCLNRQTGQYHVREAGGYQKATPQSDIGRHVTVDLKALETWYRANISIYWTPFDTDQFWIDGINSGNEYHIVTRTEDAGQCIGCPYEFVTFNDGLPAVNGGGQ